MISVGPIFEGKKLRYAGAALSGLGGLYTGGSAVGSIQAHQKTAYGKQIARAQGDKHKEMDEQGKYGGRIAGKGILGAIPVVGSISNVLNQQKLEKQKDKLRANIKK